MKFLTTKTFFVSVAIVFMFLFAGHDAFALSSPSTDYQQLENIPGFEGNKKFPQYVESIYSLAIWIVGLSAMFMLIIGGFMYMTSAGNTSSAATAKGVIKDALIGLVIALSAWLLLNTINPDLVSMNFGSLSAVSPSGTTTGTVPTGKNGDPWPDDSAIRSELASADIAINAANCQKIGDTGCTSVYNLGSSAVSGLKNLRKQYGSSITVTGGTEYWLHSSHGPDKPIVDVRQDTALGDFLYEHKNNFSSLGITKICATSSWQKISYNCPGYVEPNPHFHIVF